MELLALKGTPLAEALVGGAQRRADAARHRETTPLHVTQALIELPEVIDRLDREGLDGRALADRHRALLAALPTSLGKVSEVSPKLVAVLGEARARAGDGPVRLQDLLGALASDASEPLGGALARSPTAMVSILAWLDGVESELVGGTLELAGFAAGPKLFVQTALRQATEAHSLDVAPLHVMLALAEFRDKNAAKLGLSGTAEPIARCREAIARLPRAPDGDPMVGLPLLALVHRARVAAMGRPVQQAAIIRALARELGAPFTEVRRWFGHPAGEAGAKLARAGFGEALVTVEAGSDLSVLTVSVDGVDARVELYDFEARSGAPPGARAADMTAKRTLVVSTSAEEEALARETLSRLVEVDLTDASALGNALGAMGFTRATDGEAQLGALSLRTLTAERDGRRIRVDVYGYRHPRLEVVARAAWPRVTVAMAEEPGSVSREVLARLLEALR